LYIYDTLPNAKRPDKHDSEAQKALVRDLPKLVEEKLNSMSNESNGEGVLRTVRVSSHVTRFCSLAKYESSAEKLRVEANSSKLERTPERLQLAIETLAVGLNPEPQAIAMEAREADKLSVMELELEDTAMLFDQEFNNMKTSFGATKTESGPNDPEGTSGGKGKGVCSVCAFAAGANARPPDTISSRAWEASAAKFARKEAAQKERLGEMLNGATNALKSQELDGKTQTDEVRTFPYTPFKKLSKEQYFPRSGRS
jgi:hypothetical protein